ncbi:MAG: HIT family protein [Candidatus Paceibacterota bacterium]
MENCIFCKIAKGEIPSTKIYEDNDFFAFLDIKPVNLGHALLIPKTHVKNLYEFPEELLSKIGPVIKKLAIAVKNGTSADGINIGMNNDKAAGQLVFHAHFHIIPRFKDDGHVHWRGKEHPADEAKNLAQKIILAL